MSREDIVRYNESRSTEEAQENGRKGGIASGAARRRKRDLREAADLFMSLPVADVKLRNKIKKAGVPLEDIDYQMAMIVGLSTKANKGDAKAANALIALLSESDASAAGNKENNLLDAIQNSGEIDTDDLPEVE